MEKIVFIEMIYWVYVQNNLIAIGVKSDKLFFYILSMVPLSLQCVVVGKESMSSARNWLKYLM